MQRGVSLAFKRAVVLRSLKVGLVVGTILVLINYTDRVLGDDMTGGALLKLDLTYLVPCVVSAYASVAEMVSCGK